MNIETSTQIKVSTTLVTPTKVRATAADLSVSIERCWDTISKPELVGMWFGILSGDLEKERSARLDFNDGDFFTIKQVTAQAPVGLEYNWQFLGIGQTSHIVWRLLPSESGCTVELTDDNPLRNAESAEELRAGWLDFFQRLERFTTTGECARYDFRDDFDGSIDVALNVEAVSEKLYMRGGLLSLANEVFHTDGVPARMKPATERSPTSVSFEVDEAGWNKPTTCKLSIVGRSAKTSIVVLQSGWHAISPDSRYCIARRRFYSDRWKAALKAAKSSLEPA